MRPYSILCFLVLITVISGTIYFVAVNSGKKDTAPEVLKTGNLTVLLQSFS